MTVERKRKHTEKVRDLFLAGGGVYTCPECGTKLTSESVAQQYGNIAVVEDELQALKLIHDTIATEIAKIKAETGYDGLEKTIASEQSTLARAQASIDMLEAQLRVLADVQEDQSVTTETQVALQKQLEAIQRAKRALPLPEVVESFRSKAEKAKEEKKAYAELKEVSIHEVKADAITYDKEIRETEKTLERIKLTNETSITTQKEILAVVEKIVEAEDEAKQILEELDPEDKLELNINNIEVLKKEQQAKKQDWAIARELLHSKQDTLDSLGKKVDEVCALQKKSAAKLTVRKKLEALKSMLSRTGIQAVSIRYLQGVIPVAKKVNCWNT